MVFSFPIRGVMPQDTEQMLKYSVDSSAHDQMISFSKFQFVKLRPLFCNKIRNATQDLKLHRNSKLRINDLKCKNENYKMRMCLKLCKDFQAKELYFWNLVRNTSNDCALVFTHRKRCICWKLIVIVCWDTTIILRWVSKNDTWT